jgi:hypothetical protein
MPSIILKKTLKIKASGFQRNEKSYSFHGGSVKRDLIALVNDRLSKLTYTGNASTPVFRWDGEHGRYITHLNHDCQKYHEEDIIVAILDAMEEMGWTFKFQYDADVSSSQTTGASITSREMFIFQKTDSNVC